MPSSRYSKTRWVCIIFCFFCPSHPLSAYNLRRTPRRTYREPSPYWVKDNWWVIYSKNRARSIRSQKTLRSRLDRCESFRGQTFSANRFAVKLHRQTKPQNTTHLNSILSESVKCSWKTLATVYSTLFNVFFSFCSRLNTKCKSIQVSSSLHSALPEPWCLESASWKSLGRAV